MINIQKIISNIDKYTEKSELHSSQIHKPDFLIKNCFNRILLSSDVKSRMLGIKQFLNNELNPEQIIQLKVLLNRKIDFPLFSRSHKKLISDTYSDLHFSALSKSSTIDLSDTLKGDKSINFYFLSRNLEEEARYKKAITVLSKYMISHIDRKYNQLTQK